MGVSNGDEMLIAEIKAGNEMAFEAMVRCMQIHGGSGLTIDLPIEKFWRDQRSMMITEGPEEILRGSLAQKVLQDYAQ